MSRFSWNTLDQTEQLALRGFAGEKGVFVRPSVVAACGGDGNQAIILTQMIFWSYSEVAADNDGWFYLTSQKLQKETGLSIYVQRRVRQWMEKEGFLESEKRGIPAKNYYRLDLDKILSLLKSTTSSGESPPLDVGNAHHIVNDTSTPPVNKEKTTSLPAARGGASKSSHVLDSDRHQKAVEWVVENYPKNHLGIGATTQQAEAVINKLGKLPKNYTSSDYWAADQKLNTLRLGIKNFKAAVDAGTYDRQFVFGFAKFAGLGVQYGDAPKYLAWAEVKPVQKKPTLEGVI